MSEYIERDAAIEAMYKDAEAHPDHTFWTSQFEALMDIPAVDVRPVRRGKWKLGGYGQISDATVKWYDQFLQGGFLYCSACKERSSVQSNFCPNCGARMLPEPPDELTGTDMRGGIRRDDAGNVIDWGITGPPGEAGKAEEGK